jgi:hypothetical protein
VDRTFPSTHCSPPDVQARPAMICGAQGHSDKNKSSKRRASAANVDAHESAATASERHTGSAGAVCAHPAGPAVYPKQQKTSRFFNTSS